MVIIMELTEWLGVQVLEKLMETGKFNRLQALDISYTQALSENAIYQFLQLHGFNLKGLMLVGKSKLTENFWLNVIPFLKNIRSVDCLVVSLPSPPPNHPHPHHLTPLCFLYTLATIHRKSETFLISVTHSLKNIKSVGRLVVSPPSSYHPTTLRFLYALATTHRKSELIEDFRLTVIPFLKNIRSVGCLVVSPTLQSTLLLVYFGYNSS